MYVLFLKRKTPNSPFVKELREQSKIWRSKMGLGLGVVFYGKITVSVKREVEGGFKGQG